MSDPITTDKPDTSDFSCMTPEQRRFAETVVAQLVTHCLKTIVDTGPRITVLDKRPNEIYTTEKPNVFFRYVKQNLLEVLAARLSEQV